MRRRDVQPQLVDQPGETWRLTLRKLEDEPGERRGVDDRMLERTLEAPPDEPGVERVVAVLDENRTLREPQETATRVLELRCPDEHGAIDVVALARVGVDRRAAIDERVEKRKRLREGEALGADFEHQEGGVAGGLDVESHEVGRVERGLAPNLRRVDGDLLPGHQLGGPARLQVKGSGGHERAATRARRAHAISSLVRARRMSTAAT